MNYGKCPKCGRKEVLMYSNNPLVAPIGFDCIASELDYNNLTDADFFCRTFNIPFDPNQWLAIAETNGKNTFKLYSEVVAERVAVYEHSVDSLWAEATKEWAKVIKHEELLSKIEKIKKGFMERSKVKWGASFTFTELLQMEQLYMETIKTHDLQDPVQFDNLKKYCKISMMSDKALVDQNFRDLDVLAKTGERYLKAAGVDEVGGVVAKEGTISTVADLVTYIEKHGGEFPFYDNVSRDVVDKTLDDMKEYLRTLVTESTGLDITLATMKEQFEKNGTDLADKKAIEDLDLDTLIDSAESEMSNQMNQEVLDEEDYGDEEELEEMYEGGL